MFGDINIVIIIELSNSLAFFITLFEYLRNLNKVFINNLRLYVSLEDFFTFTSYPGFDPEASANATSGMGIDMGTYPSAKKVMLGFNVEF